MKKYWFDDSLVIITGASSGIGLELAKLFSARNAEIIGIGRNEEKLKRAEQTIENFKAYKGDVSTPEFWDGLAKYLSDNGLIPRLIVNCAGVMPPSSATKKTTRDEMEETLNVNFLAAVSSTEKIATGYPECGIANIASSASLCPVAGQARYCSSKSALKAYTECLFTEEKTRYVGLFMPGFTMTNILREQNLTEKEYNTVKKIASTPQKTAAKIFKGIRKKKKRVIVGFDARLMNFFYKLMPKTTVKIIRKVLKNSKISMFDGI